MLNYWWVTRPKRKLNAVPEILSEIVDVALNQEWQGQRGQHLALENGLENAGLKHKGERRDQTGGGGRTYVSWIKSLGLIFSQESTKRICLTLAGEAIMKGDSPVDVMKGQVLKYQFPSAYSTGRSIEVSPRFKIHPFIFLLRLLADKRVETLSKEEIAKIVIVEAENESNKCFEHIVKRIADYRTNGDACLEKDFAEKYAPSKGGRQETGNFNYLIDIANTMMNWIEYTQLARRNEEGRLAILDESKEEVESVLANSPAFIDRPDDSEYFQRKYGIDPKHRKDTRDLTNSPVVTAKMIDAQRVRNAFISASLCNPIAQIDASVIAEIANSTGIDSSFVEDTLREHYPHGAIGAFMAEYFEMAFKGRDEAVAFETATTSIFRDVFGFDATHVGPIGLTPDVLIVSDADDYSAIIDNKAYSKYSITNDHRNRMVQNYIGGLHNYYNGNRPLAFFSYIAGGFGSNISAQLQSITNETGVKGGAVSISSMIELVKQYAQKGYSHATIRKLFSLGRPVLLSDMV